MSIENYQDMKNSEPIEASLNRDKVADSPEYAALYVNTSQTVAGSQADQEDTWIIYLSNISIIQLTT